MSVFHKHHIISRHMGGSDDPSNIAVLTIEQHAEAHRILYEQHGHWQDKIAWLGLSKLLTGEEFDKEFFRITGEQGARKANEKRYGKNHVARKPGQSKNTPKYPKGVDGRKSRANRFWYTNGTEHKQCSHEDAPEGWYRGRVKRLI